jgi:hypothetical protein
LQKARLILDDVFHKWELRMAALRSESIPVSFAFENPPLYHAGERGAHHATRSALQLRIDEECRRQIRHASFDGRTGVLRCKGDCAIT